MSLTLLNFSKVKVIKKTLENGVRVVIAPIPNLSSFTLTIWVRTGSRYEDPKISGISHFLEHMVFKGSGRRPSAREISGAVDAIGGEFNAATSKDWTNFYIKARSNNLKIAFDVLSDMVLNPLLKEEEIEREKGTIVEEIRMYEDTPIYRIGDVFEELIFAGNPLGRDTIGGEKSVRGVKRNDFESYRKIHYYPENMLITVSGAVQANEVIKLTQNYFRDLESKPKKDRPDFEKFSGVQTKPEVKLHSKKKEQAHLILGFRGNPRGYQGRFAEAILAAILGGGMSSRLFLEIRERRGLAYAVKTGVDRYLDTGYFSTYAGVDPQKIEQAITVMLEQHYGIPNSKFQITNEELTKAKEYLKGHLALALEDTREVNSFIGESELFLNKIETPEEIYAKIDKVTKDEVLAEAKKLFVKDRLNLAIIGPYQNEEKFVQLLK